MTDFKPNFAHCRALLEENREKFERFSTLLLEYNARFNLTAITEPHEVEIKHFLDSLAGEGMFPHGAHVAEVGSGAGFPSIPLLLVRPDLKFTLIESTGKKCMFLREVIREMELPAEVLSKRAEDVGKDPAFREKFDVCCARAVAALPILAEYCLPLVRKGGLLVAYKGAEIEESWRALATLGGGERKNIAYELPEEMGMRTLVVVKKERETPAKYPRGNGAERRNPLV